MSAALAAYRAATAALEPLAPLLLRRRVRADKEDPARLGERLGHASVAQPPGRLVWLHGASVGEGLSLLPLVQALAAGHEAPALLVTSGTCTSARLLARRLPLGVVHQYVPVDGPKASARFLDHWRPDLAVFAESELWPNLILGARARGARTALVSARLSPSSLRGWTRVPVAARTLIGGFNLVMAQDDAAAEALAHLGGRDDGRLNLKLAGEPLPADTLALANLRATVGERPVLLAASTHRGEEALLLDVFAFLKDRADRPLMVIVPRHPARGVEIETLARDQGFAAVRHSAGLAPTGAVQVYVADTLGELGLWFRLARLTIVGGSLVDGIGGHNPLEPARLHCPAASGPHVDNWRSVYAALDLEQAVRRVTGPATLAAVMAEALTDPSALRAEAGRALAFTSRQSGAVEAAAVRLRALL